MPDTPEPLRIPIAQSVVYAVRGLPEVADEYNATRTIAPTEISLTYRSTEDSQHGRVHAYVKGRWMENGAEVPMDKPVGRHFWGRDFTGWPEWLVEEARLHDPAAVPVPPPADQTAEDRPTLAPDPDRDGVILHLPEITYLDTQVWAVDVGLSREALRDLRAVLAVLPEPTDRATVRAAALREAADFVGIDDDCDCGGCDSCVPNKLADELRRMAAEEQPAETQAANRDAIQERAAELAVLPAPVDRAALLRQEADQIRAHCPDHLDSDSAPGAWMVCHCDVADDMLRRVAAEEQPSETDTLPAWLRQRFTASGVAWEHLDGDEQSYWEHQARAVRRAVTRGGFKPAVDPRPETPEADRA